MMQLRKFVMLFGVVSLLVTASAKAQNTTVQLPTFGVAIDADGVLSLKTFRDPTGELARKRVDEAARRLPPDLARFSKLRKVSLTRLESAIAKQLAAGESPDEAMRHLAGLQAIEFVFCYPETGEIVVAGPAEGWVDDGVGRDVGLETGLPTMRLDDLLVALRLYRPGTGDRPFVGCTIDPSDDGLARLRALQAKIPRQVPQNQHLQLTGAVNQATREALGLANIRVFGVSSRTHFGQVMLDADYQMKLIGIGLLPPPVPMVTYIGALRDAGRMTLQRWWFTPDYDRIRVSDDRLTAALSGQRVQLQSEANLIGPDGQLVAQGAPKSKASEMFCSSFTDKYAEIAKASTAFAELRTMVDLAVVAAMLREFDYYGKTKWTPGVFYDEQRLPVEHGPAPEQVPCVVNSVLKGSRAITAAGGGVSIRPDQALSSEHLRVGDEGLGKPRTEAVPGAELATWWWD